MRFFYHYNKTKNKITVHYKGKCHFVDNLECNVNTESHWQKVQPRLVIRGWANKIIIKQGKAIIT